jgi:hypothetical protein
LIRTYVRIRSFGRISSSGTNGATVLALHLRPGTRDWFMRWLATEHPGLVEPYRRLYDRGAYIDLRYREELAARAAPLLRRHGLIRSAEQRQPVCDDDGPPAGGLRIEGTVGEQLPLL